MRTSRVDVLAQQRLAAGQAQLAHAVGDEHAAMRVISSKLSSEVCGRNR
jgi:hypothetical protein